MTVNLKSSSDTKLVFAGALGLWPLPPPPFCDGRPLPNTSGNRSIPAGDLRGSARCPTARSMPNRCPKKAWPSRTMTIHPGARWICRTRILFCCGKLKLCPTLNFMEQLLLAVRLSKRRSPKKPMDWFVD